MRILIAEDDKRLLKSLVHIFEMKTVKTARAAEMATSILRRMKALFP